MNDAPPNGKHILIADDSAAQRRFLEILLTMDGHRVVSVEDGLEAMAYVQETRPDLIIVDVNMPYMNGIELCENLKGELAYNNIPVIVFTNMDDEVTRQLAELAQADAFVQKPLLGKGFRQLVSDMLEAVDTSSKPLS